MNFISSHGADICICIFVYGVGLVQHNTQSFRLLRSLGHSSFWSKTQLKFFFFIPKFALPGVIIKFDRASITR